MSYIKEFFLALFGVYLINNGLPIQVRVYIYNNFLHFLNNNLNNNIIDNLKQFNEKIKYAHEFLNIINNVLNPDYFPSNSVSSSDSDVNSNGDSNGDSNNLKDPIKVEIKYENKYIDDIKKLNKDWDYNDEEKKIIDDKTTDFFIGYKKEYLEIINDNTLRVEEIKKILEYDDSEFISVKLSHYDETECETELNEVIKDEKDILIKKQNDLIDKIKEAEQMIQTQEGLKEILDKSVSLAEEFIINKKLEKLKNCYVMEKTPLGNVLLRYNQNLEHFEYYSDNTIPYRYLETVGRKFVKLFNCRPIFIDMEEELKLYEEKDRLKQEEEKIKEEKLKEEQKNNSSNVKKNVFAKFKSYNSNTGKVTSAPPKNNIPNNSNQLSKNNEKVLLKEKANKYSCEGKLMNFNFIQKIDKKIVNKKLKMTFADFKKLQGL